MRSGQPFARAAQAFALIAAAMALAPGARRAALDNVEQYESNGKRKTKTHYAGGHLRVRRAAAKRRNVIANRRAHR